MARRDMSVSKLIDSIDSERHDGAPLSAIRLFVLDLYRHQLFAADHLLRSVAPHPNAVA